MKHCFSCLAALLFMLAAYAAPFNSRLSEAELAELSDGKIVIRNIKYARNMCLAEGTGVFGDELLALVKGFSPKYLAEVIQYKPYKGNEDLPARLEEILNNVSDYAKIPYYSVRNEKWFDLYTSAKITGSRSEGGKKITTADIVMEPFGLLKERIELQNSGSTILYASENQNVIRYYDKIDCVTPGHLKICILLFRSEGSWILYGVGGVNAPRIPFMTERIETSFINRIKTFCNYIFERL